MQIAIRVADADECTHGGRAGTVITGLVKAGEA